MRSAMIFGSLLAVALMAAPALAFDVQSGGGTPGAAANLAPDAASSAGVSLDTDLRAQLGLPDDKTKSMPATKSGLSFGSSVFSGSGRIDTSSMGYDESPWVAPRRPAGRD